MCVFLEMCLFDVFVMMYVIGYLCLGVVDELCGKLIDVFFVFDIREVVFDVDALCDIVEWYFKLWVFMCILFVIFIEDVDFIDVLGVFVKNFIYYVFVVDLEGSFLRVVTSIDVFMWLVLLFVCKFGWRFDFYEVYFDMFENNLVIMICLIV